MANKPSAAAFLSDVQEPQAEPSITKPSATAFLSDLPDSPSAQKAGPILSASKLAQRLKPKPEDIPELLLSTLAGIKFSASKTIPGALAVGGASMVGEAGKQLGQRAGVFKSEPPATSTEAAKRIGMAGLRGVAGETLGRGIGKLFTAFRGSVTPEIQAARTIAEREGIEAPVSNLTENKAVQMGERVLEYSPFGGAITRQKQAALANFKGFAERVGEKIGANTPPEVTGALAKEQTIAFKEAYDQAKDKLYSAVMPKLKDTPADVAPVLKTLNEIVERRSGVASPSGLKVIKQWIGQIEKGEIKTFADLRKFRTNIGARGKFNDPALSGLDADMSQIYASASESLDKTASLAGDEIAGALKQADDFYALGKNTLKSKVYKALTNAPQDRMHRIAFVPKSPMQYDMVKEIVGPDTLRDISGQWYNEILKKSSTDGVLSPRKLLTELERYSGTIEKLGADFPDVGTKFKELTQVASLLNKGRDVATGSQTTPSMVALGSIFPSIAYSIGRLFRGNLKQAATGAAVLGGQLAASGLGVAGIKSQTGRKLLTTGFPRAGKIAARAGQVGSQFGLGRVPEE